MTASASTPAPVVVVCSAKGGAGTSTVAVNLALASQQAGRSTVLVDGDPRFGDLAIRLQLPSRPPGAGGVSGLDDLIVTHDSGLRVVLPPDGVSFPHLDQPDVVAIFTELQATAELVIVDAASGVADSAEAIALADLVLVLSLPDLAAIKNARFVLDDLRSHNVPPDGIRLVVNRTTGNTDPTEIEHALGVEVAAVVPDAPFAPLAESTAPIILTDRHHPMTLATRELHDHLVAHLFD